MSISGKGKRYLKIIKEDIVKGCLDHEYVG